MTDPVRILIVDDNSTFRSLLRKALSESEGIDVVSQAINGKTALAKNEFYKPDLITLDFEMPQMNGIDVLERLKTAKHRPAVIMLSSHTEEGAHCTIQALQLGAADFVLKRNLDRPNSFESLRSELVGKVMALVKPAQFDGPATVEPITKAAPPIITAVPRAIGIGISTGGPNALAKLLPQLPADLPIPILLVQHMPAGFTKSLAESLDEVSALRVIEGEAGMTVKSGHVYIAPGGRHMKVESSRGLEVIALTEDPPLQFCRPAVDYLFHSMGEVYGRRVLGVIMTGMGEDGYRGSCALKERGATVIAQDRASSVIFGMPGKLVEHGIQDRVCGLDSLAGVISAIAKGQPC